MKRLRGLVVAIALALAFVASAADTASAAGPRNVNWERHPGGPRNITWES